MKVAKIILPLSLAAFFFSASAVSGSIYKSVVVTYYTSNWANGTIIYKDGDSQLQQLCGNNLQEMQNLCKSLTSGKGTFSPSNPGACSTNTFDLNGSVVPLAKTAIYRVNQLVDSTGKKAVSEYHCWKD